MNKHSKFLDLYVAIITLVFLSISVLATPWTPIEWQGQDGKLHDWIRDQNSNFVDDLIDNQTGEFYVIIDLNHCVGNPPEDSPIINYVKTMGDIVYIDKFISSFMASGIDAQEALKIAARPEVAMVELANNAEWTQDTHIQAAKIAASGDYSPNLETLEDSYNWPITLNGDNINIALLDTGVNNAYESANNIKVVAGHDTGTGLPKNYDAPSDSHGTAMASWIWGNGGIAPKAGLIDVYIPSETNSDGSVGPDKYYENKALDFILENYKTMNINVVAMCYSLSFTDYKDDRSQKLSLIASKGVVVVGAAGPNKMNSMPYYPGIARGVISVSAADTHNTVDRTDDTATFVKGLSGQTNIEDLKPEIVAPHEYISPATAITAGLVALILQQKSDLSIFDNAATGSVKDLLIRGAEPKGTADTGFRYPGSSPTWNRYWGFGELDAFKTFQLLSGGQTLRTDITFKGFDGSSHPPKDWYNSPAIDTESWRRDQNIEQNKPEIIYANIYNKGPNPAENVKVTFGFYPFTAGIPKFYVIGATVIPLIKGYQTLAASIDWTPTPLLSGEHGCIEVHIDYGLDTDYSHQSNVAQRNVHIETTSSPATASFAVENVLSSPAIIDLNAHTDHPNWNISLSEDRFTMEPEDCRKTINVTVEPPSDAKPGDESEFAIDAIATPTGKEGTAQKIGGVVLRVIVGNKSNEYGRLMRVEKHEGKMVGTYPSWETLSRKTS